MSCLLSSQPKPVRTLEHMTDTCHNRKKRCSDRPELNSVVPKWCVSEPQYTVCFDIPYNNTVFKAPGQICVGIFYFNFDTEQDAVEWIQHTQKWLKIVYFVVPRMLTYSKESGQYKVQNLNTTILGHDNKTVINTTNLPNKVARKMRHDRPISDSPTYVLRACYSVSGVSSDAYSVIIQNGIPSKDDAHMYAEKLHKVLEKVYHHVPNIVYELE